MRGKESIEGAQRVHILDNKKLSWTRPGDLGIPILISTLSEFRMVDGGGIKQLGEGRGSE